MDNVLTPQVEWSLFDKNMGILERAGLAGLYLSLNAADEWAEKGDEKAIELKKILQWKLDDTQISLFWDKDELQILTKLIDWSWQIRDGVYYLPGIHRDSDQKEHAYLRLQAHCGIMGTFLQPQGKPKEPNVEKEDKVMPITLDDDPPKIITVKYRHILDNEVVRQFMLIKGKDMKGKIFPLKDKTGSYRSISIKGWLYPGVAKRFGAKDYDWKITTEKALLLTFAPIAVFYVKLPSEKSKKTMRENWAFIIPQIHSLKVIAEKFPMLQRDFQTRFDRVQVSGLGDAGLRFAMAYSGRTTEKKALSPIIYVTAMGVTDYYSSNPTVVPKVRKKVFEIKPSIISIERYAKANNCLPNECVINVSKKEDDKPSDEETPKKATYRIKISHTRGRITENIVHNRSWYVDLFCPLKWQLDSLDNQKKYRKDNISIEKLFFENIRYEWRNLMELCKEESMWDSQEERVFLKIFHDSLRHLVNKEEDALKRGGSRKLRDRWEDKTEYIRRSLMHAKTLNLTRKVFTELFAEAGGSKELTQNKELVWKFVNHPYDWHKARDLGLLGLATFVDGRLKQDNESKKEEIENE